MTFSFLGVALGSLAGQSCDVTFTASGCMIKLLAASSTTSFQQLCLSLCPLLFAKDLETRECRCFCGSHYDSQDRVKHCMDE